LFYTLGNNPCRYEPSLDFAVRANPFFLEQEDVLHADDVGERAGQFRDVSDAPRAIAHARDLHDHMDSRGNLRPYRLLRDSYFAHHGHRLKTGQCVPWSVGVD